MSLGLRSVSQPLSEVLLAVDENRDPQQDNIQVGDIGSGGVDTSL